MNDPLQLPPQWVYTSGAGWHDTSGRVTRNTLADPVSFEHGYEQGAYALAALLYPLVWSTDHAKREQAMIILRRYHDGLAHPALGWSHEPKRS